MNHWNDYKGGRLYIRGHIYGEPSVRFNLIEERPNCHACIADSLDRAEVETLQKQLEEERHLMTFFSRSY
jgi:hypothetical protein|tara:strand:- start:277 stop:486 length:210 start_codon:yes stop_codon:yes gene_type:complete